MAELGPFHEDDGEPEEIKALRRRLAALPPRHCLAFGASCCERLWPCYELCAHNERRGNGPALRASLDAIWGLIGDATAHGPADVGRPAATDLVRGLEKAFPWAGARVLRGAGELMDLEFESALAPQAEYAVSAVLALSLGYREGREADSAAVAADAAIEAVRHFLGVLNDPDPPYGSWLASDVTDPIDDAAWAFLPDLDFEAVMYRDLIETLPLMVREREDQRRDLAALAAHPDLESNFLEQFRKDAGGGGIQPFRRGLQSR